MKLVAYRLRKPLQDGRICLYLTQQELLAKLAALIPPPRQHRVRYYGVLAPRAKLREAVITTAGPGEALAMQLREASARMELDEEAPPPEPTTALRVERYTWALSPSWAPPLGELDWDGVPGGGGSCSNGSGSKTLVARKEALIFLP